MSPNTVKNIASEIYTNGTFVTLDPSNPQAEAVAVKDGQFIAVGDRQTIMQYVDASTKEIDLNGRLAMPGLNDSHLHLIRAGLNFNLELRWDGVPSLADALRMLKQQVDRTPAPQWVRVVGGFAAQQFAEKRLPTLAELNAIAPDTPVFILHLYDRALLNQAAIRAVGYNKDTPNPPGGEIEHDANGNPTGLLLALPNAGILYATLAKGPKLSPEDQLNSSRLFMRELNRLGVTSAIDAGGGFQNYPEDYAIIEKLAKEGELTVRIAYNLFTQRPKNELDDFVNWSKSLTPLSGDSMYRHNGGGEMLVYSAADFEDFRVPRPDMPANMEEELEQVVRLLVEKRWPFRLHATYNETIGRALDVFEKVNQEIPFDNLHWFFDHAETITQENIDRVKALGGGIAIQHRMAYQGEYFVERYGADFTACTPPIGKMLATDIPVGAGTDATRVASYNPWICLYWLVTGKTLAGMQMYNPDNRLDRQTAYRLWTEGSAWFCNDVGKKGLIKVGHYADFIVPSSDYFTIPEDEIKDLTSHLTVVDGRIVFGDGVFSKLSPPMPSASPDWSPVGKFGGYYQNPTTSANTADACACGCDNACPVHKHDHHNAWMSCIPKSEAKLFWGLLGCNCWM